MSNVFEHSTCVLHINLPTQRLYTHKKYESTDEEEAAPAQKMRKKVEVKQEETVKIEPELEMVEEQVVAQEIEVEDNPLMDYQTSDAVMMDTGDVNITIEHP